MYHQAELLECLSRYEQRFATALAKQPSRQPWTSDGRWDIQQCVRSCLGCRQEWVPTIDCTCVRQTRHSGFAIEHLSFTSWPQVHGAAHLYLPDSEGTAPVPIVILCCGHGAGAKFYPEYQRMARHLVRLGTAVLVFDNIGQGERLPMGHHTAVLPFACGTSVQGLIVTETLAWVQWVRKDPRFDPARIAAAGNSGGGALTLFLSALSPDIAVLSSSGQPCTFDYVARKEKQRCHCNLTPRIVGELDMWQLLGCFAPRPLLIFQGLGDQLFPADLFYRTVARLQAVYDQIGASQNFQFATVPGEHGWDLNRRLLLGDFFRQQLNLTGSNDPAETAAEELLDPAQPCIADWPADALTIDDLARRLTGRNPPSDLQLWDVFPPDMPAELYHATLPRGSLRQILAQFEAALKPQ